MLYVLIEQYGSPFVFPSAGGDPGGAVDGAVSGASVAIPSTVAFMNWLESDGCGPLPHGLAYNPHQPP